jgi:hypothetical protein
METQVLEHITDLLIKKFISQKVPFTKERIQPCNYFDQDEEKAKN